MRRHHSREDRTNVVQCGVRGNPHHRGLREICEIGRDPGVLDQPRHHRRDRQRPGARTVGFGQRGHCVGLGGNRRHAAHRLLFKDLARGERKPRCVGRRRELDRHDGIAAEGEERIGDTDLIESQQRPDDLHESAFVVGCRWHDLGFRRPLGRGQRVPIEFATGSQREGLDGDDLCRHHVRGQSGCGASEHFGDIDTLWRNNIADEPGASAVVGVGGDTENHSLGHAGCFGENRFDLTELDALPVDLHLVVDTSDELQVAGRGEPGQVSGGIHSHAVATERIGNETRRSLPRTVHVAASHTRSRQVELTDHTLRYRMQASIEDVRGEAWMGASDGDRLVGQEPSFGGPYGGLSRAVSVEDSTSTRRPALDQLRRARLTHHHHVPDRLPVPGVQRGQHSRCDQHVGDLATVEHLPQRVTGIGGLRCDDQRVPGNNRGYHLREGRIEAHRGHMKYPGIRVVVAGARHRQRCSREHSHPGIADTHSLGAPGGAGGVDQVHQVVQSDRTTPLISCDGFTAGRRIV